MMTQVRPATRTGMIAVRMSDHRFINGLPWIDVEIAGSTIKTFIRELNKQTADLKVEMKQELPVKV
jgi:hypothetical protein